MYLVNLLLNNLGGRLYNVINIIMMVIDVLVIWVLKKINIRVMNWRNYLMRFRVLGLVIGS